MAGEQGQQGLQGEATEPPPPNWHPDPYGGASHRWWDGAAWTDRIGPAEPQAGLRPMEEALDKNLMLAQKMFKGDDLLRTPEGEPFG